MTCRQPPTASQAPLMRVTTSADKRYHRVKDAWSSNFGAAQKSLAAYWRRGKYAESEITRDFVVPTLGIDSSAGLPSFDPGGRGAACLIVLRKGTKGLNSPEKSALIALRPHIYNLYPSGTFPGRGARAAE